MQTMITQNTLAKIIKVSPIKLHQLGDRSSIKGEGLRMCSHSITAQWGHITHKLDWHFTSGNPTQPWIIQEFALPPKASQFIQIQHSYVLLCLPKDMETVCKQAPYACHRHTVQHTCTLDRSRCCYQLQSFLFLFPVLSTTLPCNRTQIFSLGHFS